MAEVRSTESTSLMIERGKDSPAKSSSKGLCFRRLCSRQGLIILSVLSVCVVIVVAVLLTQGDDETPPPLTPTTFASKVKTKDIHLHLSVLYNISQKYNNTRSAILGGYNESVDYVVSLLNTSDYYTVTVQPFTVQSFREVMPPVLNLTQDGKTTAFPDVATMGFSASDEVFGSLRLVSGLGCQAEDWIGLNQAVAVVQRQTNCTLYDQALLGLKANVVGIVFGNTPQFPSTQLRSSVRRRNDSATVDLPMIGTSYDRFLELKAVLTLGPINVSLSTSGELVLQYTANVIADLKYGRSDQVIVIGSHLDSVEAGPGINDNGSGSSMNLQVALELRNHNAQPTNKLRFIWFGAEELGLLGSYHYVNALKATDIDALRNISCMLNFDMVASPNYIRGIYDGMTASNPIAAQGSRAIQRLFESRFDAHTLPWQLTEFNERSDYAPFTLSGIPAGGVFTGAEGPVGGKTAKERRLYGGIMNVAYDTCYHLACDDLNNINSEILGQMTDAAAFVIYTLAEERNLTSFLFSDATILHDAF